MSVGNIIKKRFFKGNAALAIKSVYGAVRIKIWQKWQS